MEHQEVILENIHFDGERLISKYLQFFFVLFALFWYKKK